MADPDLIACLYPFDDGEGWAKRVVEELNPSRYVGPARPPAPEQPYSRGDREPTQPPDADGGPPRHLELRFSHGPRTTQGFVLGKDPDTSDIVLVNQNGISDHHCAITFEDDFKDINGYRLVIRDLKSSCGTSVEYDKQAGRDKGGVRRDFRWIVSGHDTPEQKTKTIVLELHKYLKFQIVVSRFDMESQPYVDSVNLFRQGVISMDNLFAQLGLPSRPPTEPPSGAHTPGTGAIYVKKKLGEGAFGVVTYLRDVSDGDEYALKKPSRKAIREKRVDVDAWKKEARIMARVSDGHDHIVKLLGAKFTPLPQLKFEYLPGGALRGHVDVSADEGAQVLLQCASALAYLHGLHPPVVHRDIKPDNILVQSRDADGIYVKFGDFGLSRESRDPTTMCGSWRYAAPEMFEEQDRRKARREKRSYTLAVDIWSLGVTLLECVYDPPSKNATGVSWCQEIVKKLKKDRKRNLDGLNQVL